MTASLKVNIARIDRLFNESVSSLPQVTRVVAVHAGPEPAYVVTVDGDWVANAPAVHRAVRPLRRDPEVAFTYRTVRRAWREPDPTSSTVLFSRS
jgi:hypothetical protein